MSINTSVERGASYHKTFRNLVSATLFAGAAAGCTPSMHSADFVDRTKYEKALANYDKCANEREELANEAPQDELPFVIRSVNVKGAPGMGRVLHYRQIHGVDFNIPLERKKRIIQYQLAILRDLLEKQPDIAIPETHSPNRVIVRKMTSTVLRNLFPKLENPDFWPSLSPDEKSLFHQTLFRYSAMHIYPFINKKAGLMSAGENQHLVAIKQRGQKHVDEMIRLEQEIMDARVERRKQNTSEKDTDEEKLIRIYNKHREVFLSINYERERVVTEMVMRHLKDHPSHTVAIAYGAAHDFCDDFRGQDNPPQVESIIFPRQLEDDLASRPGFISRPCHDWIADIVPEGEEIE